METQKIKLSRAVVVEGKYDKIRLESILDAVIVTTNGFGLFKDQKKKEYLKKLGRERGILILTDSDSAGFLIRNHLKSFLPDNLILNAYIPKVEGKERRKATASKEGILGVEGMEREILLEALRKAGALETEQKANSPEGKYAMKDLFCLGLTGGTGSREKKKRFLELLGLPDYLSNNALIKYMNTAPQEEIRSAIERLENEGEES